MEDPAGAGKLLTNAIRCPGLTSGAKEIQRLAEELPKRLSVFSYRQHIPSRWVVFLGGTGTGKSTLFNAFCGKALSETGVERPITVGPILYAHRNCHIEKHFPFLSVRTQRRTSKDFRSGPVTGTPGHLLILEHDREDWSHLVLVDTPDLDSVEEENRRVTEEIYLLSDVVVFVTSQEKYADEVPYQFLQRVIKQGIPCYLLLNKAQQKITKKEVIGVLGSQQGAYIKDRMWIIPHVVSNPSQQITERPAFLDFVHSFSREFPAERIDTFLRIAQSRRAENLKEEVDRLLVLLEDENRAAERWLEQLLSICQKISYDLIEDHRQSFEAKSRKHLRAEVRRLFSKYDVLAKPRRFLKEVFLTPFRLIGFGKERSQANHREELLKARKKIDLTPIQSAIEKLNRSVIEKLSPSDETSPLFSKLRKPGVMLEDEEIKERIWEEQDRLGAWMEETFRELSQGLPKSKKWGIYSTSILWGIFVLSFETAVGGGFSMMDAALDSALAPFITKGAVELFAYQEIQKIASEMGKRYQEGLLSVVNQQRERYEDCLRSLMTSPETLESLRVWDVRISN
jgi:GTPase Era involved in 16S rRNA processing